MKVITVFPDGQFCLFSDNFHIIIYSICSNFISNDKFNMSSTGWCLLFDIIHSVERVVSCKRQVLFIAFFLYNDIVDYWLFTCPGRESWILVIRVKTQITEFYRSLSMVANGFVLANGMTLSKDLQNVYSANCILSILNVFKREENDSLMLEQEFELYSMPDNINIELETGTLIIAANPTPHMMAQHLNDPEMPSASKVLMVNMKNGSFAEGMTGSAGIWGASVGNVYKNKLLMGTVHHKLMYCEVRTL